MRMRKRGKRRKSGVKGGGRLGKDGGIEGGIEGTCMRGELQKKGEGRRGGEGEHSCMRAGIGLF